MTVKKSVKINSGFGYLLTTSVKTFRCCKFTFIIKLKLTVKNKICSYTEHKEIKPSTNNEGSRQVDEDSTRSSTTPGTN